MANRYLIALAACAALSVAPVTNAQQQTDRPLLYDHAYASLALTELDSGGLEFGGSFTVAPNIHVFGSYQDWELNDNSDRSLLQIGAARHWDISPNLDIVGKVAFGDSEIDRRNRPDIDDSGLIFGIGLRGWATNELELSGEILLDDSLGSDIDTVVEIGGHYFTSPDFSFDGRVRIDEEETTLFLGLRFYFGRTAQP